jgi:hypothetical protein
MKQRSGSAQNLSEIDPQHAKPVGSNELLYSTGPVKWPSSADASNGSAIVNELFGFMEHVVSINNKVTNLNH